MWLDIVGWDEGWAELAECRNNLEIIFKIQKIHFFLKYYSEYKILHQPDQEM